MFPIKKTFQALTTSAIAFTSVVDSRSSMAAWQQQAQELPPQQVVEQVYAGLRYIHKNKYTPQLYWNIKEGTLGGCGQILGSQYCPRNHTIYITQNHIQLAYQYGDAALAYIVAHEYAHAMQVAFKIMPRQAHAAELQADCLAGAYFGAIPNIEFDLKDAFEAASLAHKIGDYHFTSAKHHGTPEQRYKAISHGMKSSTRGAAVGIRACRT